jgi:hypothetical protein
MTRIVVRRRCQEQLLRVSNSICIIESHANAIEGTELNKSILDTIRASGDAIKRLSVRGGIGTVEDIISEVETQMENASEITKVISAGTCLIISWIRGRFLQMYMQVIYRDLSTVWGESTV